ncbi:hypothetical protein AB0I28_28455 [Phytomonospora sp. NPDC050363]|uniref:hypothetical protein n=1 Tax=Phytomonospora sp. NPDC050363 TaxID=3155642 RepID=UPI0033EC9526
MSHTHELTAQGPVLRKRYRASPCREHRREHRREHHREWAALRHLAAHAPGLTTPPLAADLTATPPWITMAVIPGAPVDGPYDTAQLDALEHALGRLWAVPVLTPVPIATYFPPAADFAATVIPLLAAHDRPQPGVVREAYDAALAWASTPGAATLLTAPPNPVLGHGDPNPANCLWDTHSACESSTSRTPRSATSRSSRRRWWSIWACAGNSTRASPHASPPTPDASRGAAAVRRLLAPHAPARRPVGRPQPSRRTPPPGETAPEPPLALSQALPRPTSPPPRTRKRPRSQAPGTPEPNQPNRYGK